MATKQRTPKTLLAATRHFKDPQTCIDFLAAIRWPDGVKCPTCGNDKVGYLENQARWQCSKKHPKRQFSVKVGTIFEDSPIGLDKWLPAMWLIVSCKNGISSYELARGLGVTQTTAWFMLQRLRLAMQQSGGMLGGNGTPVEVDETWIGGAARWMNKKRLKKANAGKEKGPGLGGKALVLGMLERGGRVVTKVVPDVKRKTLVPHVKQHVELGSAVHSDSLQSYAGLQDRITAMSPDAGKVPADRLGEPMYDHEMVDHQAGEYVRDNIHVNGIENFWSLLKRTIKGTYVSVEPFHLFRYLDEQAFRFNERKHEDGDAGRFVEALGAIVGRRLTYRELIGVGTAGPSETAPA
jgi:transposase-like protein